MDAGRLRGRRGGRRRTPCRGRHRPREDRVRPGAGLAVLDAARDSLTHRAARCRAARTGTTSCSTSVSGAGTLELEGEQHDLEPDAAAHVRAGETVRRRQSRPGGARSSSRRRARSRSSLRPPRQVTVRFDEQPELRADAQRTFRFLVNEDAGCMDATQFVGIVAPFRAPDHSHPYDEVGFILEGEGFAHIEGRVDSARPRLVLPPAAGAGALHRERRPRGRCGSWGSSIHPATQLRGPTTRQHCQHRTDPTGRDSMKKAATVFALVALARRRVGGGGDRRTGGQHRSHGGRRDQLQRPVARLRRPAHRPGRVPRAGAALLVAVRGAAVQQAVQDELQDRPGRHAALGLARAHGRAAVRLEHEPSLGVIGAVDEPGV